MGAGDHGPVTRRSPVHRLARDEIFRFGGRRGKRLYSEVVQAAEALAQDREEEAIRLLSTVRDQIPRAASVRELLGLSLYRAGRYRDAIRELQEFERLTRSDEAHPVLMDCQRALRHYDTVDELWRELRQASPSPELVVEGRIVAAGALADQGRLDQAVRLLEKRSRQVRRPRPHDLRLWYALADLEERAGNLPGARSLFERIIDHDRSFADAAERLAALS